MPSEHDVDIDAVADAVVERLDPGTVINDKVVLSRRQALALASGTVGLGALVGTSDVASAQASGQVGTSSDPVDVEAYDLAVNNQLSSNVDAGGNDVSNVGSLSTDKADTRSGYTDETSNRSFDTFYQNTTGSDLDVIVQAVANADNIVLQLLADVNNTQNSNPADKISVRDAQSDGTYSVGVTVPDGYYYQIAVSGDTGSFSLERWSEQQ